MIGQCQHLRRSIQQLLDCLSSKRQDPKKKSYNEIMHVYIKIYIYILLGRSVSFHPSDQAGGQAHARLHEAIELAALVDFRGRKSRNLPLLLGGFKDVFIFSPNLGEMIQFSEDFSDWLKPPTSPDVGQVGEMRVFQIKWNVSVLMVYHSTRIVHQDSSKRARVANHPRWS